MMGRSSVAVDTGRRTADGVPLYGYRRLAGVPPVGVAGPGQRLPHALPHAHDFLVIGLVLRGAATFRVAGRELALAEGELFLVSPGEVVDGGHLDLQAWTAFFAPDAVDPAALRSWRAHPLLFPFVRGPGGGTYRLAVPRADRAGLAARFAALDRELRERRDGWAEALTAHLALLLVDVARLAADVPGGLRLRDEPLLAEVFDVLESRFAEPISLRDVAAAVGLTPGHLTTLVRRRTGRTVQQWLTERRMAQARRLLADTDLPVGAVAGRVGYRDAGYFIRTFRRAHGVPPLGWRRAATVLRGGGAAQILAASAG